MRQDYCQRAPRDRAAQSDPFFREFLLHRIWLEVCRTPTKAAALAVLSQYLWEGREVCRRQFFGSADILHVCGALFMFMHGDWFVNPRHDPDCPTGGMPF